MKLKGIIVIILLILISFTTFSYANGKINPDDFKPANIHSSREEDAIELGSKIIGGIMIVGTIIAVGTMIVLGIRYMVGSVEQRAEYKKTMMPYLIGAFLTFSTCTLLSLIYNIVTNINV